MLSLRSRPVVLNALATPATGAASRSSPPSRLARRSVPISTVRPCASAWLTDGQIDDQPSDALMDEAEQVLAQRRRNGTVEGAAEAGHEEAPLGPAGDAQPGDRPGAASCISSGGGEPAGDRTRSPGRASSSGRLAAGGHLRHGHIPFAPAVRRSVGVSSGPGSVGQRQQVRNGNGAWTPSRASGIPADTGSRCDHEHTLRRRPGHGRGVLRIRRLAYPASWPPRRLAPARCISRYASAT